MQQQAKKDGMIDSNRVGLSEEKPKTPSLLDMIAGTPVEPTLNLPAPAQAPVVPASSTSASQWDRLINSFAKEPARQSVKSTGTTCDKECSCDLLFEAGVEGLGQSGTSQLRRDFDRLLEQAVNRHKEAVSEDLASGEHQAKIETLQRDMETLMVSKAPVPTQDFSQQFDQSPVEKAQGPRKAGLNLKTKLALAAVKKAKDTSERSTQTEMSVVDETELQTLTKRNQELEEMVTQLKLMVAKIYANLISN